MTLLKIIGTENPSYPDRPTVKAVVRNNDEILILNTGFLPGGGIENSEDHETALKREIQEEVGASINGITEIGHVIQYRDHIKKKYVVYGFVCDLVAFDLETNPQDENERNFKVRWTKTESAINAVKQEIERCLAQEATDDSLQGKLFNLQTTLVFLNETKSQRSPVRTTKDVTH